MKIETKYNLGDYVYFIFKTRDRVHEKCKTCNGTGRVKINNTDRKVTCPDCYGAGSIVRIAKEEWKIGRDGRIGGRIGKIDVEVYDRLSDPKMKYKYMLDVTGVGTGTVWFESDLFITEEEAQKECDKRNKEMITN